MADVDCLLTAASRLDTMRATRLRLSMHQAYEMFCDEFSDWIEVKEPDTEDYPEDEREYNSDGVHIDASMVQIREMQLLQILF